VPTPADQFIGKNLIAKIRVDRLNSSLQKNGIYQPGELIGTIYSYIVRGNVVYWLFNDAFDKPYLVEHQPGRFIVTDEIREAEQRYKDRIENEKRQEQIEQKGAIPYYIEKYGKWLVLIIAATVIAKTYINKQR